MAKNHLDVSHLYEVLGTDSLISLRLAFMADMESDDYGASNREFCSKRIKKIESVLDARNVKIDLNGEYIYTDGQS